MNGLVLVDKPAGCSSHDVVDRWRRLARTKKVGHLGTLDPMATGLLLLVTGSATRLARFFETHTKTYEAEIKLGLISDTYDIEGVTELTGVVIPNAHAVEEQLRTFIGPQTQMPPSVSAKKIRGVAAYKLVRQQKPVQLNPVPIEIYALDVHSIERDTVRCSVKCSTGTYIRSIAHDLGKSLGCGAVLSKLRRTASGEYSVNNARTLPQLEMLRDEASLPSVVIPSATLLEQIPTMYVDDVAETYIRQGRDFRASPFVVTPGSPMAKAVSFAGDLIAIGELRYPNVYHPVVVL